MSSFDVHTVKHHQVIFPKSVPSSVQVLFQVDESYKLDYLKNPSLDLKNSFCLSSYEFLAMLEGKIWKCPFF